MNTFFSTKYSARSFNLAMLILRCTIGALLLSHGYAKLIRFNEMQDQFMNFAGLGSTISLVLIIFAEVFCSVFLILGLFTRWACIPIGIAMSVVVFMASNGEILGKGEKGALFLAATIVIFLCGPGKASLDAIIKK